MNAGPCDDELTHKPLTNVRLAELPSKSDVTANHNASAVLRFFTAASWMAASL
jgi:hypothetical protein